MTDSFLLSDHDFTFPPRLIAAQPAEPRDSSRLMVLDRKAGTLEHARFSEIGRWLKAGDCLVLNRTRVIPARLVGRKVTGGKVEVLLLKEVSPSCWSAMASFTRLGATILFDGAEACVEASAGDGECLLRFSTEDVRGLMASRGSAPLPPYILKARRAACAPGSAEAAKDQSVAPDLARYQTVYAQKDGSVAAPTAGLHFTPELLESLRAAGVRIAELTLHVGRGTFKPIDAEDVRAHVMLPEEYEVPSESAELLAATRAQGGRVIAVGTTATRTLETLAREPGSLRGSTGIFIHSGHVFRGVDVLLTNFHQPKSTPLLLTCAFAGRERVLSAYREAIAKEYRLFSYGDAMLIV
ncbi:MAG: tRNA preQ1(34) S-adenosylmethionine ribosyltransferase-isomerase QueA [Elusimicrobiota bacterium]|jgi:S-adenosylmethionine:tRNA ribosyltransferase-isomerase